MPHTRLRQFRKRSGTTVKEIASALAMTAPAYRRYERGEVDPRISQCIEIVHLIGCRLTDIWDVVERPSSADVTYKARPGQTVFIKIEYDDETESPPKRLAH